MCAAVIAARPTLPIGSTIGKYEIRRVLGAGGMGAVYLAENRDIGRQVAIKVLHPELGKDPQAVQRFRLEARATTSIDHPGVVDVLDLGEAADGSLFIVMERLDGQTLGQRLAQRGKLDPGEAVSIMVEALDAIGAAHAKGIVHRDLKPENLFLVWHPRWCVKVLDFGISRFANTDEIRITASNTVMGTVLYMAPEQARDVRKAGPPADLYAIGAVLYHLLAGHPPFLGSNYSEVLSRVLTDKPGQLLACRPDLPPALADVVMKLLEKDPEDRYATAKDVKAALLAAVPAIAPPVEPIAAALADTVPPADALAATAASVDSTVLSKPESTVLSAPGIGGTMTMPPAPLAETASVRRRPLLAIGAAVLAAATIAVIAWPRGSSALEPPRDAASITPVDAARSEPDAAASPPDANEPAPDAAMAKPDAAVARPAKLDAGVTKPETSLSTGSATPPPVTPPTGSGSSGYNTGLVPTP